MNIDSFCKSNVPESELNNLDCPVCFSKEKKFLRSEREYPLWTCGECSHIYVSPQPSAEWLENYYDRHYWQTTEMDWKKNDKVQSPIFRSIVKAVSKEMPNKGRLLDIGMSYGGLLSIAKEKGWDVYGIEPSEHCYSIANNRISGLISEKCLFADSTFSECHFDAIVALNVIEHVHDPYSFCKKVFALLKPGGCIALRWPECGNWIAAPAHLHQFTAKSIEKLYTSVGFCNIRNYWAGKRACNGAGVKKIAFACAEIGAKTIINLSKGSVAPPFVSKLTIARKPQ